MKGAIFDVDGTLLDSMPVWGNVLVDFFKMNGRELSAEEFDRYKDLTLDESIPMMIDLLKLDKTKDEVLAFLQKMIFDEYKNNIQLKKDADKYLEKLHNDGVKIAIATSGYEELCKTAFERLGVWKYIDACAFSAEVGVNKSNPDVYLLAAERIELMPEECTVFEDITKGICGAKKGGFKTCAIYDISNAEETDVLKQLSDHYITGWEDLL